jgi:hypothetical protein
MGQEVEMIARAIGFLILLVILCLALLPNQAWAAGVGVSPHELDFEARSPGSTRTLHVINSGNEESHYKVYAEGEYEGWFEIAPDEFSLAPSESIEVKLTLAPPSKASGEHRANICVVSFEPSSGLQVGVGVKVPAHISLSSSSSLLPMVISIGVVSLAVLVAGCFVWRNRRTA